VNGGCLAQLSHPEAKQANTETVSAVEIPRSVIYENQDYLQLTRKFMAHTDHQLRHLTEMQGSDWRFVNIATTLLFTFILSVFLWSISNQMPNLKSLAQTLVDFAWNKDSKPE